MRSVGWIGVFVWLLTAAARAETLPVGAGAGKRFATPCEAVAHASPHDVIEIAAGTYTDSCALGVSGLTLRGAGSSRPKIDLSGTDHPAQYKAIYVVTADDVSIENLELTGAHVSDANGANAAAVRIEAAGLHVSGCDIHDNQNGILGGSSGTVTLEHNVFYDNGLGDGCNAGGCTHNVYIGAVDALYFRFNWSHRVATDTDDKGHLLKSRAKQNFLLYNRLSGEDGYGSYEIDLPNGGLAVLVGNVVQKGRQAGNSTSFSWGEEGVTAPDARVFLINNTFVSALGSGRYVNAKGAELSVQNNLFVGAPGMQAPASLPSNNLVVTDMRFVDADALDYHLRADSPARGQAMPVMSVDALPLMASSEYVQPAAAGPRASVHDLGAFEYAADDLDAGAADGGKPSGSAGQVGAPPAHASDGGAGESGGSTPSVGRQTAAAADSCGCSSVGAATPRRAAPLGALCMLAWAFGARRRRTR